MYVLHVVESFGAGTMQVVRQIARSLADRGERTAIAYGVVPETPPVAGDGLESVELIPLPWSDRGWRTQFAVARRLRRILDRERPDVVHLHSSFAGFVGALAGGAQRSIYTPHGYSFQQTDLALPLRLTVRAIEVVIARRVDRVVAVSHHEQQLARARTLARDPGVVLNGIPELDAPVRPSADRARASVIAAGRVTAARRPRETAEILSSVRDLADVAWVGGGGRSDADQAAVAAAGVVVTGWLERAAALERLRDASVYLHWSAWDGLSLAILEAFAADVPVVASHIPANAAVVPRAQLATDTGEATALVRRLLTDPAARAAALAEQRRVAPRFSGRRMCDEWHAQYRMLARDR